MVPVNMYAVRKFFDIRDLREFRAEWAELSIFDKRDLSAGIDDGTLSY
jgi:hypothetical protein